MAKSNRDRVGEMMDALRDGLGPYVMREFKAHFGAGFIEPARQDLTGEAYTPSFSAADDEKAVLAAIDIQGWLNLIWRKWDDVFRGSLGKSERSYVSELMTARNDWAHQKPFTSAAAQRVADTAGLLLNAVGANEQAIIAQDIARELMRLRFDEEAKQSVKKAAATPAAEEAPALITQKGLKPWRTVVRPHPFIPSCSTGCVRTGPRSSASSARAACCG